MKATAAIARLATAVACSALLSCRPAGRTQQADGLAPTVARVVLVLPVPTEPVPETYFGIHIHRVLGSGPRGASPWPQIGAGSLRLWDSYVSWADLEPAPGGWRFERLDSIVALANMHHTSILLTLGRTPRWASSRPSELSAYGPGEQAMPASLANWTSYVSTIAQRYRGRIAAYELWNEPNHPGMFSGSVDDMSALANAAYAAIKAADPSALVISPSPVRGDEAIDWMQRYQKAGGLHYADVIAFHPYATNSTPETMVALVSRFRRRLELERTQAPPLWLTELGWFIQDPDRSVSPGRAGAFDQTVLSDSLSAAYVARALILGWCAGADRLMWYAWDNGRMGLVQHDSRTEKEAAVAFRTVSGWMTGATFTYCARSATGEWTVSMTRPIHRPALIIWNDASKSVTVPTGWSVSATALVPLGPGKDDVDAATRQGMPLLVERDAP